VEGGWAILTRSMHSRLANAAKAHLKPAQYVLELITTWRTQGRGLREIARELNRLNITTPRGCQWYACTVRAQLNLQTAGHPVRVRQDRLLARR
jgi:hypothetical protein